MLCRFGRFVFALAVLVPLASCGSGFVAIFSGNDSGGGPPAPSPALVPSVGSTAPLFPAPDTLAAVEVQNVELPATLSRIQVELRAFGDVVVGQQILRLPRPNTIQFLFSTLEIQSRVVRDGGRDALTTRDVPVEMAVLVDGAEVAPPVGIVLLRQPTAEIEGRPAQLDLSPLGQVIDVRLRSVSFRPPDTTAPVGSEEYTREFLLLNGMTSRIAFGHTADELRLQQLAVITSVVPQPADDLLIKIAMPAVEHPTQAHFTVDSAPSGRSTLVSNAFYRPATLVASPAAGATEGGTTVVLFGKAMVPQKTSGPPALDFDRMVLTVHKGGRETTVDPSRIRRDISNADRLVFTMPPAPDGLPGFLDINVRVTIDRFSGSTLELATTAAEVFTYGDSSPYFGSRGVQLRDRPAVVEPAPFVGVQRKVVDVLTATGGPGGMPFASVFQSRGNGMFTRFGQPLQAGLVSDPYQRNPVDLCFADFVGNGTRSGLILNGGSLGLARHSFLLGSETSNPPIRFDENFVLNPESAGLACAVGEFNNDRIPDLVVLSHPLPSENSAIPVVFLSNGTPTNPSFDRVLFSSYPGPFLFSAVAVADLDGDGEQDLLLANGGSTPRLLVAFGTASGVFRPADIVDLRNATFDLASAGLTPDSRSRVLGVHALVGSGLPTVALVFSGVAGSSASPPAVVHVRRTTSTRGFAVVTAGDIQKFAGGQRTFTHSSSSDLNGDGSAELLVAVDGDGSEPLLLFRRGAGQSLELLANAIEHGVFGPAGIQGIGIGLAVEAGTHHQAKERLAVFVTHSQSYGSSEEHRLSTYLVDPAATTPRLLAPDAARRVGDAILATTVGRFFPKAAAGAGVAMDAWLAVDNSLLSLRNDGLGELAVSPNPVLINGILPSTLSTVQMGSPLSTGGVRDMPAFLTSAGNLGVVLPDDSTKVVFARDNTPVDLRVLAPITLRSREVQPTSSIRCADIDQDGYLDLVVLLGLAESPGNGEEGESVLLLFRGQAQPKAGEFPYDVPSVTTTVESLTHGNVTSFAIGDFVTSTQGNVLELALALPRGGSLGNEVRFYRWDSARAVFSQSYLSTNHDVLPVGIEPVLVVSGDYDSDGRIDLAVASRRDDNLWVFYNFSAPTTGFDVDIQRFQSAPANPLALPIGTPRCLLSADVNGDAAPDLVAIVETGTSVKEQQVVYFLSPGRTGGFGMRSIPPYLTGNHVPVAGSLVPRDAAVATSIGDLNGDGAPDLVFGWATSGVGDYNLRVLFGNNF